MTKDMRLITKKIKELDWIPKYDFNEGIHLTVKWVLDNSEWMNQPC